MKAADLMKRIEALEARVRELEARPVYVPYAVPQWPAPQPVVGPWRYWEGPTCGTGAVTNWPGTSVSFTDSGTTTMAPH